MSPLQFSTGGDKRAESVRIKTWITTVGSVTAAHFLTDFSNKQNKVKGIFLFSFFFFFFISYPKSSSFYY